MESTEEIEQADDVRICNVCWFENDIEATECACCCQKIKRNKKTRIKAKVLIEGRDELKQKEFK